MIFDWGFRFRKGSMELRCLKEGFETQAFLGIECMDNQ